MAAKDDKNTIYGEPVDREYAYETAKKYNEAAGDIALMKKVVQDFLHDLYTAKLSIKEPHKKNKAGQMALLKFDAVKSIYAHLIEKGISPEDEKMFVTEIFRQIVIFDMGKMIKHNIEARILTLEQDVQELRSKVALLEKANSSNERFLLKVALEMINFKKGIRHVKAAVSRLKSNAFQY